MLAQDEINMKAAVDSVCASFGMGSEVLTAAAAVISKRTRIIAQVGAIDHTKDHLGQAAEEMARMVPEKAYAFAESAALATSASVEIAGHAINHGMLEVSAAGRAADALRACRSPAELLMTQWTIGSDLVARTLSFALSAGASLAASQRGAMAPVHRTVCGNMTRLNLQQIAL
jgi:hypothetical protein